MEPAKPASKRRATLYSRSAANAGPAAAKADAARPRPAFAGAAMQLPVQVGPLPSTPARAAPAAAAPSRWRRMLGWRNAGLAAALLAALMLGLSIGTPWRDRGIALTQKDIDAAVLHTLETKNLPSRQARAAAAVMPSIVLVRGNPAEPPKLSPAPPDAARPGAPKADAESAGPQPGRAVGTGVVIAEDGTVLTSWHVVAGAARIVLTFHDRSESEAVVVSVRADKDLAVLKPKRVPDDLQPATLRSTAGVVPGDEVVAVGFPFGIGPSVSAGVVSGLGREHRVGGPGTSRDGGQVLTNLIQFDAAANPGNSGGPLVTMDGQVVGIVCSILNPTDQAFFIGIGMAVPIEDAAAAAGMPPA